MKKNVILATTLVSALAMGTVVYGADSVTSATAKEETKTVAPAKPSVKPTTRPINKPVQVVGTGEIGDTTYRIQEGDTLAIIAAKFNTNYQNLAVYNNIADPHKIYAGNTILIPGPRDVDKFKPITPTVPVKEIPDFQKPHIDPVPPVTLEPVTPTLPVVESTKKTYVGIKPLYVPSEAGKWEYFVQLDVEDDKIVGVNWDAWSRVASSNTKKEDSKNGTYGMVNSSKIEKAWFEQAKVVEDALLKHQTLDVFELAEDGKHLKSIDGVDTTASVSIKVDKFLEFAGQAMDKMENTPVTPNYDAFSSASVTADADTFVKALGADASNWLTAGVGDIHLDETVVIDGKFHSKNDETRAVDRKITISNHGYKDELGENGKPVRDRGYEEPFVLSGTEFVVNSPNTRFVNSTIVGDFFVTSENFQLNNVLLIGNLKFANEEVRESAIIVNSTVTGDVTPDFDTKYQDGVFKVEADEFSKGWKENIEIAVKYGKIVDVKFNAISEENEELDKKTASANGEYVMAESSLEEKNLWNEQIAVFEKKLVSEQGLDNFVFQEDELHLDGVSGATIKANGFVELAKEALKLAVK